MKQYNKIKRYTDFLQLEDNSFILWRLSQTAEQNQIGKRLSRLIRNLKANLKKRLTSVTACVSMNVYILRRKLSTSVF